MTQHNSHMEREIEKLKQERIKLEQTLKQHQCSMGGSRSGGSSSQGGLGGFGLQNNKGNGDRNRDGDNVRRFFCTYQLSSLLTYLFAYLFCLIVYLFICVVCWIFLIVCHFDKHTVLQALKGHVFTAHHQT